MTNMNLSTYLSQQRGRHAALAKAIGVHAPDISRWLAGERPIPKKYGPAIERATGGQVTRRELFPDEWRDHWPELAAQHPPAQESQPQ